MVKDIEEICEHYQIRNWQLNCDGLVDVNGHVNISFLELEKIPVNFGRVTGFFNCASNLLTSLKGCPKYIGRQFNCSWNRLTSLEFFPEYIGGFVNCRFNKFTKRININSICSDEKVYTTFRCVF